jgi:hypothetical protein
MSQDALELLLSGVKDQAQRKQITSAYYAFANGDPETFAVQFAVLLRAHAMSLKLLPARLEKTLAAETHKMSALVLAHQNSVERMTSLIQEKHADNGGGEAAVPSKIPVQIEEWLNTYRELIGKEREAIIAAIAKNGRLTEKLTAHRILLILMLSYLAGLLTTPAFVHLLSFFRQILR